MGIIFILKRIGFFVVDNWRAFVVAGAILIAVIILWRAFRPAPPKLDEGQIQRAEQAKKQGNDAALKEILAESDTRVVNVDAGIKQAEENTRQAVKAYDGMSRDDLTAEIERRKPK